MPECCVKASKIQTGAWSGCGISVDEVDFRLLSVKPSKLLVGILAETVDEVVVSCTSLLVETEKVEERPSKGREKKEMREKV